MENNARKLAHFAIDQDLVRLQGARPFSVSECMDVRMPNGTVQCPSGKCVGERWVGKRTIFHTPYFSSVSSTLLPVRIHGERKA